MRRVTLAVAVLCGLFVSQAVWGAKSRPGAQPAVAPQPGTFATLHYTPPKLTARLQPYTVASDLGNVANRKILPTLTAEQRAGLARNGFVGWPTQDDQLFFIYENNAYRNLPSFISTDSILQVYHIFYDFTLRSVETKHLDKDLHVMTAKMLAESRKMLAGHEKPGLLHDALVRNVAYFAVATRVLEQKTTTLPPGVEAMVAHDVDRIAHHQAREASAIFPYKVDFSQFVPRGHYTRSEQFKRYFKAMMWYGLTPFALVWPERPETPDREQTLQALLISRMLRTTGAAKQWDAIYSPTAFYVGLADDLTPAEYAVLADQVFGKNASLEKLADPTLLDQFIAKAKTLRKARIETYAFDAPNGPQFRLMGQRFIPDSRVLQEVTYPKVQPFEGSYRTFPRGLDVMAALGNARAAQILDAVYKEPRFPNYLEQRRKMQAELAATPQSTWESNLYWGWLYTLRPLLEQKGAGYPSFMLSPAWQDKSLITTLASWTELRHDTILYGKQSTSECGDGEEPPPPPKSYVEPEPEVYARLLWLTKVTASGLRSRGLLDDDRVSDFGTMQSLLQFLLSCSLKELSGQELTRDEYYQLKNYGANLERLTLNLVSTGGDRPMGWSDLANKADKDMAVVADVHTDGHVKEVLEEGVGRAVEIWVVVPIRGKLWLTRGTVFSQYEFREPMSNRLTDEEWQKRVAAGKNPPLASWTQSYIVGTGRKKATPREEMTMSETGC